MLCCHAVFPQEDRFSVKVGIGTPGNQTAVFPEVSETMRVHGAPAYRIETGYTFPRHITVEAYIAYADVSYITGQSHDVDDQGRLETKASWLSTDAWHYGAKVGYHPLADWLERRRADGQISVAHFSDILRCMLLSVYGGLWLDACTLLTGKLPEMLFKYDFFVYQRDPSEPYKKYWESTFAYYWGWDKDFRVKILIGIMYAKAGSRVISDITAMLYAFWKSHDAAPDYFFFQILFDIYVGTHRELNCQVYNDCIPHMLRQAVNEEYPFLSVKEILERTTVHSLNYKNPKAADNLKALLGTYIEG